MLPRSLRRVVPFAVLTLAACAETSPTAVLQFKPSDASVVVPSAAILVAGTSGLHLIDATTLTQTHLYPVSNGLSVGVNAGIAYVGQSNSIAKVDLAAATTSTIASGVVSGPIYGIAISGGQLFASGSGMSFVRRLDLNGAAIGLVVPLMATNLRASAFGPGGQYYVAGFNNGVDWWTSTFSYQSLINGGGLNSPFGVGARSNGNVIVSSQNLARYFVYTSTGGFIKTVPVACVGQLRNVAVDAADNVYVTCNGQNEVVKFDAADNEVARFSVPGPSGIAVIGAPVPPPADVTPPTIAPSVVGTVGDNGWYTSNVTVAWNVDDPESAIESPACVGGVVSADTFGQSFSCTATSAGGTASASVTVKRDATAPSLAVTGNAGSYSVAQTVAISCTIADATSGIAMQSCSGASGPAYSFGVGTHAVSATATDNAGNSANLTGSFTVTVDAASLCALVKKWVNNKGIANSMCKQLENSALGAFRNHVSAQSGKALGAANASILIALSSLL